MSTWSDRTNTPSVSQEMVCAMRGLSFIRQTYGETGIARLKKRAHKLNIASCWTCALAIASQMEYNEACYHLNLYEIPDRAHYGFTIWFPGTSTERLTAAWKRLIAAL